MAASAALVRPQDFQIKKHAAGQQDDWKDLLEMQAQSIGCDQGALRSHTRLAAQQFLRSLLSCV